MAYIRYHPLWNVVFQIAMEVTVIEYHIHFLVDCFYLSQNLNFRRSAHILNHILIKSLKISSQYDVEVDCACKVVHVVSTKGINYVDE